MGRICLITTDKGFSNHRDEVHYGILIIRLKQPIRLKIHQRVMQSIKKYKEKRQILQILDTFIVKLGFNTPPLAVRNIEKTLDRYPVRLRRGVSFLGES